MAEAQMSEAQIQRWLQMGPKPGLADRKIEQKTVPHPTILNATIGVREITYVRNDGQRITVRDVGENNPRISNDETPELVDVTPAFEVTAGPGDPTPAEPRTDPRSPEKREEDEILANERRWNQAHGPGMGDPSDPFYGRGSGRYESHRERAERELKEQQEADRQADRQRATEQQQRVNELAQSRLDLDRENTAADNARAERQLQMQADQYQFERDKANRPSLVGTPTDTQRQIATFDPSTGTITAQANPLYDEVKVEAVRKREELATAIQLNQISAQQAAQQYQQWWQTSVQLPFMQAAEARAQAAEQRAALQAEEQRRQFAANFELQRGELGERAASRAQQGELAMLPYRTGPKFGSEMSSAINSLGSGGSLANNASAGINFSPGSFQFKRPNIEKIAQQAAARAVKGITAYKPLEQSFASSGGGVPQINLGSMPSSAGGLPYDLQSMFNQMTNYQYGGSPTIPVDSD